MKYVESLDEYGVDNNKKLVTGSSFNDDVIDVSENIISNDDEASEDAVSSEDETFEEEASKEVDSSNEITKLGDELDKTSDFNSDSDSVNDSSLEDLVEDYDDSEFDEGSVSEKSIDLDKDYHSDNDLKSKQTIGLDDDFESAEVSSKDDLEELNGHLEESKDDLKENKSKSKNYVYSNYLNKEPKIKNRAYYRQAFYGDHKPDIDKYKLYEDVDSLINSLKYPDSETKQKAVQALGVIGDPKALKPLKDFINEEAPNLKIYAEIAVNQIESKKTGFKSKNRNYYRNIYASQKATKPDLDVNKDIGNKPGNKLAIENNNVDDENIFPESDTPNIKTNEIKSINSPVKTHKSEFSEEKSSESLDTNSEHIQDSVDNSTGDTSPR